MTLKGWRVVKPQHNQSKSENFPFLVVKFSIYLNRHVFVMISQSFLCNQLMKFYKYERSSHLLTMVLGPSDSVVLKSSLKPLCWLKPNCIYSLIGVGKSKFINGIWIRIKMAVMPIYGEKDLKFFILELRQMTLNLATYFYTPGIRSMQWGYIVFVFSVCLSVSQSVC